MKILLRTLTTIVSLMVASINGVNGMESDNPSDKEDIKQTKDNLSDIKKNEENIKSSDNEEEIENKADAECSDDDIEKIDWDTLYNMTPEKAYEILAKKYYIPYTDWDDPKDVEKRRKEIEEEFRVDLQRGSEISDADLQRVVDHNCYIIKGNCCFEKLYARYAGRTKSAITENEYCSVFSMIQYAKGDECEWHYDYKWFDRVSIHWAFMVTKASDDLIIFNNQKIFKSYSDVISSDNSCKKSGSNININSLNYFWRGAHWSHKVAYLFEKIMVWYNGQLDVVQAKIELHKINKHYK